VPAAFEAVYQPEAGFLPADRAILAHVSLARRLGAEVHEEETVRSWRARGARVEVVTDRATYEAGSLILAGGAWSSRLLPRLQGLAVPERQVVGWFATTGEHLAVGRFPVFIFECPEMGTFYGFPERGSEGFKIGKFHHRLQQAEPDRIDREIEPEDVEVLTGFGRYLSRPIGRPLAFKTCMFVNSPDEHFIIDLLPEHRNVAIAAGFSGHGYKFCSGVGEVLADLVMHGATRHDINLFALSRPALAAAN
jgi:sarcosine oxidase